MKTWIVLRNKTIFFSIFMFYLFKVQSQIYINEFQAYNASSYLEKYWGNFVDWIELYNAGNQAIDLGGYYISDDINYIEKWELPSELIIYPGSFVVIYADKVSYRQHTNFSLNGDGDQIILSGPDLNIVDSLTFGLQYPDISFGRYPDGSDDWYYFENITPKDHNSSVCSSAAIFAPEPQFSIPGGFYSGSQSISIGASSPTATIKYTLNGSKPTINSTDYTEPILINSTTVIRAIVIEDGIFSSQTVSHTYFIDRQFSLPVLSISMDNKYLYDDEIGIYVVGTNGITGNCSETPKNYNQDWERPINIELYDNTGKQSVNQVAGTKIFGACSRRESLKSLSIFARSKYGKGNINYQLFNDKPIDKFKSFIIRNSGNDFRNTMLRDAMMHNLVKNRMDIDYQEYQPAIIFLNGNYWGILNIREKLNEDYLESNHGIDADSVDILYKHVYIIEGDDSHYQNMMNFIRSNDLSVSENYQYVTTQMDISQFMNYQIAEIYFFNQDWPQGNNKYWRPQKNNGKWRWLLYDTDFGFGLYKYHDNMVQWATRTDVSTELFLNLMKNNEFYGEFLQRFSSHMNTSFLSERVIPIIDSLKNNIETEMPGHIDKWYFPGSMNNWYNEIQKLKDFAANRLPVLTQNLINEFELEGQYTLNTEVSNPDMGRIQIAGVQIPNNFSGLYFKNISVRLEAIPKDGYKFSGWEGISTSSQSEIRLSLESDSYIKANFNIADTLNNIHINEFSSKNDNAIRDDFGEYEDWIELYNSGTEAVDLAGLYLTDSIPYLNMCIVPDDRPELTVLFPDSTIILYADNDPKQGPLHLNFKLSNDGGKIGLTQKIGEELIIIDSLSYQKQYTGITMGRLPDGFGDWQFVIPTPGKHNLHIESITNLYINEICSNNSTIIADNYGGYDDWIEIYNNNDTSVNIGGLFLTDNLNNLTKYRIPETYPDSTTIPAKSYILLWADDQKNQGILHLNFKLSSEGEQIGLIQPDGKHPLDTFTFLKLYKDITIGRYPDGETKWSYMNATPRHSNIVNNYSGLYINELMASNSSIIDDEFNEYDDWIEIFNSNNYPVNIGGLFITDSLPTFSKHRIPTTHPDITTIPPQGFLLLWADSQKDQGILHLSFKLSSEGEQIGLAKQDGIYIDTKAFETQYTDITFGRFPDGKNVWSYMNATPRNNNVLFDYSGLFINEFMASNSSLICDEFNEYDDWIEIFNSNDYSVDIGGLYLTDSLPNPDKQRIPTRCSDSTTIPPKGFLLLWADNQKDQGILHLNFKLSSEGEQIGLSHYNGIKYKYIDSITFNNQNSNLSSGRVSDGADVWTEFIMPTPGTTNNTIDHTITQQKDENGLIIYPNPVTDGVIYLSQKRNIRLYNNIGFLVHSKNDVQNLNLGSIPKGIYILKTEYGEIVQIVVY
ncbi:MAG: lamin tail domain-containing protein [Bacteroidales bacterium]|nr:lamin tail domain-containing protein [Bacteroidales bacterium]